ncbi:Cell division organizing protein PopZ [hydrothermal vent metagenome]|uniref:Cell division organizing protein PopZ n=1 Tax=hydrothermal vent metagenome TaxID=652676 RepID=A0A3B0UBH4_9ZZZZ
MNNPASKEPSMDEILSSIRQIIADEDQPAEQDIAAPAAAVAMPEPVQSEAEADQAMMEAQAATPAIPDVLEPADDAELDSAEPLALTPDQMIEQNADATDAGTVEASTVDDDLGISFSPASSGIDANSPPALEPETEVAEVEVPAEPDEEIELVIADDIAFDEPESEPEEPAVAEAMPDPELSTDMTEKLLEPTTAAAVTHTFSKLNALAIGGADLTLEAIVRDMLRPMLKEWLDENLPATVERMVEKEIERVSRGS